MKSVIKKVCIVLALLFGVGLSVVLLRSDANPFAHTQSHKSHVLASTAAPEYWLKLHRKSNKEILYQGVPGNEQISIVMKEFKVKTGIPGERPTPLPQLFGRDYWVITEMKEDTGEETAPYFLTLNIPTSEEYPYGPVPYLECGGQCNWVTPGAFGLHGVAGKPERLSEDDPGSSGCIRHSDEDITYLYELLKSYKGEIRYYIQDM